MQGKLNPLLSRSRLARNDFRWVRPAQLILLAGLTMIPWRPAFADEATEQQLRAALQQATAQIAQLQNQVADLQAQEAPDQAQIAALQTQLQSLKQGGQAAQSGESKSDKEETDKQVAVLSRQLAAQQSVLGKAQAAYQQAAIIANTNATANQQLTSQVTALKSQQSSCEAKNVALYQIGNDILSQLGKRDTLWGSFSSAEPFIGTERVKLQTIVQSDQDKLDDNQIVPAESNQ